MRRCIRAPAWLIMLFWRVVTSHFLRREKTLQNNVTIFYDAFLGDVELYNVAFYPTFNRICVVVRVHDPGLLSRESIKREISVVSVGHRSKAIRDIHPPSRTLKRSCLSSQSICNTVTFPEDMRNCWNLMRSRSVDLKKKNFLNTKIISHMNI